MNPLPSAADGETTPDGLASLVLACRGESSSLLVLADYLEEMLNLTATAALLRSPLLCRAPEEYCDEASFEYFPLAPDVFLWLAAIRYRSDPTGRPGQPGTLVGLYAHPAGKPRAWAKVAALLPGEESTEADPLRPWQKRPKEDPLLADARRELTAFAGRRIG